MHGFAMIDRFAEQLLDGARALHTKGGPGITDAQVCRRRWERAGGVLEAPERSLCSRRHEKSDGRCAS
jgi:hypothetical protein